MEMGFKVMRVYFPPFTAPLSSGNCVTYEHILEVQEWYRPPVSLCQVWWGLDLARRRANKNQCF